MRIIIRLGAVLGLLVTTLSFYEKRESIVELWCSVVSQQSNCHRLNPPTLTPEEIKRLIGKIDELTSQAAARTREAEDLRDRANTSEKAAKGQETVLVQQAAAAEQKAADAQRKLDEALAELKRQQQAKTSRPPESNRYLFVWDTRRPDDWLDLWERPGSGGRLISHMPNGTELDLLEKGPDKWYKFRVVRTGEIGWAAWANGSGNRIWIYCCKSLDDARPSSPTPYGG